MDRGTAVGRGMRVSLDDGYTLRFSSGHTVSGPYDRRTLTAPSSSQSNQRSGARLASTLFGLTQYTLSWRWHTGRHQWLQVAA